MDKKELVWKGRGKAGIIKGFENLKTDYISISRVVTLRVPIRPPSIKSTEHSDPHRTKKSKARQGKSARQPNK